MFQNIINSAKVLQEKLLVAMSDSFKWKAGGYSLESRSENGRLDLKNIYINN